MTVKRNEKNRIIEFLLTCLLRGMTNILPDLQHCNVISTHMPLARHDYLDVLHKSYYYNFYSHASCEA